MKCTFMIGGVYMLCPYCDHELSETDEVCPNCGEKVDQVDEDTYDTDDEDLFKEDNAFTIFTRGLLSGLDFTWRALIRPDQSMARDKTPILISTITLAILFLVSTLLLYIYLDKKSIDGVNLLYWLEIFAVFVIMFALVFGVLYVITKLLISREVTTYRMIQDFCTLSVFVPVFFILGVGALYFDWVEVFLLFMLIVFSLIIINPVVLVTKYMMTYRSKIGVYFTNILMLLLVLTIFMLGFYVSLHDLVFKLIQIL